MPRKADRKSLLASELIAQLEKLLLEYGDMPITLADSDGVVARVGAYDEEGGSCGNIVEFSLHRGVRGGSD